MEQFIYYFICVMPAREVTWCTFLSMVPHYSTDLQVFKMGQEIQQCANKNGEEEDCKLINMDVNNIGLKMFKKLSFQTFYEGGNVFNSLQLPPSWEQRIRQHAAPNLTSLLTKTTSWPQRIELCLHYDTLPFPPFSCQPAIPACFSWGQLVFHCISSASSVTPSLSLSGDESIRVRRVYLTEGATTQSRSR